MGSCFRREKQRPAELTSARQAILQKARANFTNAKLWHEVLEFFVTNYTGSPEEDADIEDMLQQIQKHRLLQPLVVLSTLSKRADFPFRMVRNYAQYYMMKDAKQARKVCRGEPGVHPILHQLQACQHCELQCVGSSNTKALTVDEL